MTLLAAIPWSEFIQDALMCIGGFTAFIVIVALICGIEIKWEGEDK